MLTGSCLGRLEFLNSHDLSTIESVRVHENNIDVVTVQFSPDGSLVFTESEDPYIRVWDVTTRTLIRKIDTTDFDEFMWTVTPNGTIIFQTGKQFTVVDYSTGNVTAKIPSETMENYPANNVFCSDTHVFVVHDGKTRVFSVLDCTFVTELDHYCSSVSLDGKFVSYHDGSTLSFLAVRGNNDTVGEIGVIETGTWELMWTRRLESRDCQFSRDGFLLSKSLRTGSIMVLNAMDGSIVNEIRLLCVRDDSFANEIPVHDNEYFMSFTLSSDGVVVSTDKSLRVYSMNGDCLVSRMMNVYTIQARPEMTVLL
jgi:WD40 repeat protein